MNRPSVDPAFTFAVSLAISLVLWFPTLRETMNGDIEITDAGIRYFLALAIAWAGVYGVSSLVAMYASKPRARRRPRRPDAGRAQPARRGDDPTRRGRQRRPPRATPRRPRKPRAQPDAKRPNLANSCGRGARRAPAGVRPALGELELTAGLRRGHARAPCGRPSAGAGSAGAARSRSDRPTRRRRAGPRARTRDTPPVTGQIAQIALASSACDSDTGKKTSVSASRHAASSNQSVCVMFRDCGKTRHSRSPTPNPAASFPPEKTTKNCEPFGRPGGRPAETAAPVPWVRSSPPHAMLACVPATGRAPRARQPGARRRRRSPRPRSGRAGVRFEGYEVHTAVDGNDALLRVDDLEPDLDRARRADARNRRLAVCRILRDRGNRTPVLMLTARHEVSDRVAGPRCRRRRLPRQAVRARRAACPGARAAAAQQHHRRRRRCYRRRPRARPEPSPGVARRARSSS